MSEGRAGCPDCDTTFSPLYMGPWHKPTCPMFSLAWEPLTSRPVETEPMEQPRADVSRDDERVLSGDVGPET